MAEAGSLDWFVKHGASVVRYKILGLSGPIDLMKRRYMRDRGPVFRVEDGKL